MCGSMIEEERKEEDSNHRTMENLIYLKLQLYAKNHTTHRRSYHRPPIGHKYVSTSSVAAQFPTIVSDC